MIKGILKKLTIVLIIATLGCAKNKTDNTCDKKMIQQMGNGVSCSPQRDVNLMDVVLAKGTYRGATIYFMLIVCPVCNTVPPQEGFLCSGEKVTIEDFNKTVSDISTVKGCD